MHFIIQPTLKLKLGQCGDVIAGMNFLHTLSPPIIHGELTVDNVVVDNDYVAKVIR